MAVRVAVFSIFSMMTRESPASLQACLPTNGFHAEILLLEFSAHRTVL